MSSLISRGTILFTSRFLNQVLYIFSPIILVRLFDMKSYGQYQQFNLYAIIFVSFFNFGISSNLVYFLNKYPKKLRILVSNTAGFLLISSVLGTITTFFLKDLIFSSDTINHYFPLCVFIFFSLNMAFWDVFWIAKKKVHYVLYYSTIIMFIKVCGVILITYFYGNVVYAIWWLCIVQIGRFTFVLINAILRKWFTFTYDKEIFKKQINYFYPIGTASALRTINQRLSNLFVAQILGVEALAIYSIGSRNIPVTNLFRQSIVDIVFPDIVERGTKGDSLAFLLWQKTNIVITIAIVPIFVVCMYFAEEIINIIFTSQYIEAVPLFRVYLFVMIIQSFEFTLPIRNKNKNYQIIIAGAMRFICNTILLIILMKFIGILGAAISAVFSEFIECTYLGYIVCRLYSKNAKDLLMWKKEIKIFTVSIIGLLFLWIGQHLFGNNVSGLILNTIIYFIIYTILLWKLNIEEFNVILKWCRVKFGYFFKKCFV